ncbi:MAG: type II toxin-antitoxin system Phd/YefM family antitoxin [Gammaproteobacteria bacterium]|nr:type II toxin-antitoxin system Phd/YefM family antitoxin [Gammaproteobacteria bacterium]
MAISITEFKNTCLEVIRCVEKTGRPVSITRRGKVVARIGPSFAAATDGNLAPWEQLRAMGGRLIAKPGESAVLAKDFEALR